MSSPSVPDSEDDSSIFDEQDVSQELLTKVVRLRRCHGLSVRETDAIDSHLRQMINNAIRNLSDNDQVQDQITTDAPENDSRSFFSSSQPHLIGEQTARDIQLDGQSQGQPEARLVSPVQEEALQEAEASQIPDSQPISGPPIQSSSPQLQEPTHEGPFVSESSPNHNQSTNDIQQQQGHQQASFAPGQSFRNLRASRRSGASFYQQHIYTIDSVAFILRISLEQATELVKQNPELIEKYHNGKLKKYLTRDSRSPSSTSKSKRKNKTKEAASEDYSQHSDINLSQIQDLQNTDDELYTDNEEDTPSEHSSSEHSDGGFSDQDTQENQHLFTFRGRKYKSLDEVARVSKLPKSFFQLQNTTKIKKFTQVQRSNRMQRDGVGVAKRKKKSFFRPGALPSDENLFTTGDDSQNNVTGDISPYLQQGEPVLSEIPEESSDEEVIHKQDDDLFMFEPSEGGKGTFYETNESTALDRYYGGVTEDYGSDFQQMLAPTPKALKTPKGNSVVKMSTSQLGKKAKRFKRKPSGSVKKPRVTGSSLQRTRSPRSYKETKRQGIIDHYRLEMERQTTTKYAIIGEEDTSIANPLKDSTKKPVKKKRQKSKYFFIAPTPNAILPRSAQVSTVIYEGLSDKFAIIRNPRRTQGVSYGVPEEPPSAPLPLFEDNAPLSFQGNFASSTAYKKLFEKQSIPNLRDYKVQVGQKSFTLSKLLPSVSEVLKEIFTSLLEPAILRNIFADKLMDSLIKIVEFCTELEPNEAKSLVNIVDNFRFQLENRIRRIGQIRDVEFYYLSFSYILFYCCQKSFKENFLNLFDFRSKAEDVVKLYFQFLSYLDGAALRERLNKQSLFSESVNMLFITDIDITWTALELSEMSDMGFLRELCGRFQPEKEPWLKVRKILKAHLDQGKISDLKLDFNSINIFVKRFGWKIDEETLSLMFECLKRNKFQNFPGEGSNPVIYNDGINSDSITNIYLNLLVDYAKYHEKLSARFFERVVPVSKPVNLSIETFCNRMNILLCSAFSFKRNLDSRISDLISSCELGSKIMLQRAFKAVQVTMRINNSNRFVTELPVLQDLILVLLKRKELEIWMDFLSAVQLTSLLRKTQKEFLSIIANYKTSKVIIKSCTEVIKSFMRDSTDNSSLTFIRDKFGDLNSTLFSELWCFISGELVRKNMENWSRLMSFNNFEDECFVFTYILRHSGPRIYQLEKNKFVNSLIKNIVKRKYSSSLNSYIREIERIDPKLLSVKSAIVQTQKLQLTLELISSLLKSDSLGAKSRYLSLMVNFLKAEHDLAIRESDIAYGRYVNKAIDFINIYGFEYVNSSKAFETLCQRFNITRKISNAETNYLVNFNGNIQESLRFIEAKLIQCLKNGQDFTKTYIPLLLNHTSKKFGTSENVKDSKLYSLCCSTSIHIEALKFFPSCWIILSELTRSLSYILEVEKRLTRIDIFCILKTVSLFPHALRDRPTRYEAHEYSTMNNIYKILKSLFYLLSGTNDLSVFNQITLCFTSREVLYEPYSVECEPRYLIVPPEFIKDMVIEGNLTTSKTLSLAELKESLEENFNGYVSLIDSFNYDDNDAFY